MTYNTVESIREFLNEKPGYRKKGISWLADYLDTSEDLIAQAKGYKEYQQKKLDKDSDYETEYQKFLSDNGIDEEDVTQVYYKEKASGIRFTVQTRHKEEKIDEEKLYNYLKQYKYKGSTPNKKSTTNSIAVLSIFDAHIDKLSYTGNGGKEEMNKNIDVLLEATRELISEIIQHKPHLVIFPIGNDFFNTNGAFPETKKGTPQDISVHWQDSFHAGIEFYRQCIDMISEHTDVYIMNIPGNHDHDKNFYLGEVLKAVYEYNNRVFMNMSKDVRKYIFAGEVLFGFAHGAVEKRRIKDLPTAMAIERPKVWGQSKHKIWILGDVHHQESYKSLTTLEHNGVDIKFLRSATNNDTWHQNSLWIGAKKSISYSIYKNGGKRIINEELFI